MAAPQDLRELELAPELHLPGDREAAIRTEVQEQLRQLLDADALLTPGPSEYEQVERLVAERIAASNRRDASLGRPPLAAPERLTRQILDDLLGLGPLQSLLDDPRSRRSSSTVRSGSSRSRADASDSPTSSSMTTSSCWRSCAALWDRSAAGSTRRARWSTPASRTVHA